MKLEAFAAQLEALGHATRLEIFLALVRAGDPGMPVKRLQERLDIPGSTLSHHVRRLVQSGLVTQERQSTTLVSRADRAAARALVRFMSDEFCAIDRRSASATSDPAGDAAS